MNFDFYEFLHFVQADFYQINKNLELPKIVKMPFLQLLDAKKLISRKIWVTEKSWEKKSFSLLMYFLLHFTLT